MIKGFVFGVLLVVIVGSLEGVSAQFFTEEGGHSLEIIRGNFPSIDFSGKEIKEYTGRVDVIHIDDFENSENSRFEHFLWIGNERYKLVSIEELPVVLSGTNVKIRGVISEDEGKIYIDPLNAPFIIINRGFDFSEIGNEKNNELNFESLSSHTTENLGEQRTLVIVANIGENEAPATVEEARHMVFDKEFGEDEDGTAQDYYIENSYGKASLVGDVLGPYTLDEERACQSYYITREALIAAEEDILALGKTFYDYDRLILIAPRSCGLSSAGTLGKTLIELPNGEFTEMSISWDFYFLLGVILHELGHNFGVSHASKFFCLNGEDQEKFEKYSYGCYRSEYGDYFSVMGRNYLFGHHNAPHKKQIGWLEDDNIITTMEGTYALKPLEGIPSANAIQMIQIPINVETNYYSNTEGLYYTIEFRQHLDYDKIFQNNIYLETIYDGITVRVAYLNEEVPLIYQTHILPLKDGDQNNPDSEYWIRVGENFVDHINGYKITLDSISGEGIDASANVIIEKIPKREINFDEPLVYYDFEEEIVPFKYLKDNAGYAGGGIVIPGDENAPENKAGGILFHGLDFLSFRENNEHVSLPGFPGNLIAKKDEFTFSAWIYLNGFPNENKGGVIYGDQFINRMEVIDSGKLSLSVLLDQNRGEFDLYSKILSDKLVELYRWHHVVGVFNGRELSLYIDGKKQANKKFDRYRSIVDDYSEYNYLGGDQSGNVINGIIDEFKIYAKALSEEEVVELYESFTPIEDVDKKFTRGNANGDNSIDISDPVYLLNWLFKKGSEPPCMDAADANDDGIINIADPIYLLNFLFKKGNPPSAPYERDFENGGYVPNFDPTADNLDCLGE